MNANKDQKRQKDNPNDKVKNENQKKGAQFPGQAPKPFQQFSSSPNKFKGNPGKSTSVFHRGSGR